MKTSLARHRYTVDGSTLIIIFRFPTLIQRKAIDAAFQEEPADEDMSNWTSAAETLLEGWEGDGAPMFTGKLAHVLTRADVMLLRARLLDELDVDDVEKKTSFWHSRIAAAPSNASANPNASASHQTNPSPSPAPSAGEPGATNAGKANW